ncbi:acyl carrier protein [Streptacidiphilus fuscans]|uniref:Acyl carrier protein n=1 Tax=Streptacidiphilus fuscans TaxID=2789292 RepID=A0A931FDD3_9ACTN|nr:acyl carrier protein [Streptacidiphilus fuscans]MBF9070592.1 acyl carrier protein [Streptacidiphilus fuscans]
MNDTDDLSRVRAIVAEVLALSPEEIDPTEDFVDRFQADSLNLIEIVAQVEKQFKVVLPQSELRQANSVAAFYDLVARQAV